MIKRILLILFLLISPALADQQNQVVKPYPVYNVDNESSTIAVTNTFQQVFPDQTNKSVGRTTCVIQNNGANVMYVFFGPTANATIATSVKLAVGQSVNCDVSNVIIKTAVQITGTNGDAYYAAQW